LNDEVRAVHEELTTSESTYNKYEDDKHGMNCAIILSAPFSHNHETLTQQMRISYLLVLKKPLQLARGAMTQTPERNATEPGLKMPKTGSFGKQSRAGSSPKETVPRG
jgi:hypothetical protein